MKVKEAVELDWLLIHLTKAIDLFRSVAPVYAKVTTCDVDVNRAEDPETRVERGRCEVVRETSYLCNKLRKGSRRLY